MHIKIQNFRDINLNLKKDIKDKLQKGALIVYPTDTVYGLGAIVSDENALEKIYKAKSREFSSPLIALVNSIDKINEIASIDDKNKRILEKLSENFWPGALTVILKKKDIVPGIMVSHGKTVGVRIPNLEMALEIIELAGGILATTSANISGEPSPKCYADLSDNIKNKVDIVIDGGKCKIGEASTIIDLTKQKPKILRKGAISIEDLEKIIGEVEV